MANTKKILFSYKLTIVTMVEAIELNYYYNHFLIIKIFKNNKLSMIDNLNLTVLLNQNTENLPKTRIKKPILKLKQYDEETRKDMKMSRLRVLEEDEDLPKEEYLIHNLF
jgi:hypothetical protein